MEAAGLAALSPTIEETKAKEHKEFEEAKKEDDDLDEWTDGWNTGFTSYRDLVIEKYGATAAQYHKIFYTLIEEATAMRNSQWPFLSSEERKTLCPTLTLLINKSQIILPESTI